MATTFGRERLKFLLERLPDGRLRARSSNSPIEAVAPTEDELQQHLVCALRATHQGHAPTVAFVRRQA